MWRRVSISGSFSSGALRHAVPFLRHIHLAKELYWMIQKQIRLVLTFFDSVNGPPFLKSSISEILWDPAQLHC